MTDSFQQSDESGVTTRLREFTKNFSVYIDNASEDQKRALFNLFQEWGLLRLLEDWQRSDRRKHTRKPCSMPIDYAMGNRVFKDVARDISAGGVFIRTPAALSVGEEILLPFSVPTQKEPIRITGEIVRSVEEGIGVKFKAESSDLEAMIESL